MLIRFREGAMKEHTTDYKKTHFDVLDFLRFFASLSVVFYHYCYYGVLAEKISVDSGSLMNISSYGFLGVDLFFMISGFVIFISALKGDVAAFVISRIGRLYPGYWICLFMTILVITIFSASPEWWDAKMLLFNMTMLQGVLGVKHVDGVYWTLAVEIVFYFWIAVLLLFKQIHRFEFIAWLWALLSVFNIYFELPEVIVQIFLLNFMHYFLAGAVFYLCYQNGGSVKRALFLVVSFCLAVLTIFNREHIEIDNGEYNSYIVITIIAFFYAFFLLISLRFFDRFSFKYSVLLGSLTYPLYLIHQEIGYILIQNISHWFEGNGAIYVTLTIVLILSFVIAVFVEKPLMKLVRQKLREIYEKIFDSLNLKRFERLSSPKEGNE